MRTPLFAALFAAVLGCKPQPLDPSLLPQDAPVLDVHEPAGAAFLPTGPTVVRGSAVGLTDVKVQGLPATMDGDSFEATVELARGVETIEVSGVTADGHTLFQRLSVLAGEFRSNEGPMQGAAIRVNQGGLDAATDLAAGLFDVDAINDELTALNPVYVDSYSVLIWEAVEIEADIGGVWFDPPRITLDPKAGQVGAEIELPNLLVTVPVRGSVIGIDFDVECTLAADAVVVGGNLPIGTDGAGKLTADLTSADVQLLGFYFDTSLLPGEIEDWLLADAIQGVLEDLLIDKVAELVPPLLEDQLSALELSFETELMGKQVAVSAAFAEVTIDSDGLELQTEIDVDIPGNGKKSSPGYLVSGAATASPAHGPDLAVALSDDLVNRLLHDVWRAGMLDLALSTADGSLDPMMVAALGAAGEATITLDPKLPPVLLQDEGRAVLELGEFDVILDTPGGHLGEHLVLTLSGAVPVDLEIADGALDLNIGSPELTMMVRENDWGANDETITRLMESELPLETLLVLLGAIQIPLPTIGDIAIPDAHVDRDRSGTCTTVDIEL